MEALHDLAIIMSFVYKRKRKSSLGNRFIVHDRRVSAIKTVEFLSDRMSYIVLRGR